MPIVDFMHMIYLYSIGIYFEICTLFYRLLYNLSHCNLSETLSAPCHHQQGSCFKRLAEKPKGGRNVWKKKPRIFYLSFPCHFPPIASASLSLTFKSLSRHLCSHSCTRTHALGWVEKHTHTHLGGHTHAHTRMPHSNSFSLSILKTLAHPQILCLMHTPFYTHKLSLSLSLSRTHSLALKHTQHFLLQQAAAEADISISCFEQTRTKMKKLFFSFRNV